MQVGHFRTQVLMRVAAVSLMLLCIPFASAQTAATSKRRTAQGGNIQIPSRPAQSLFQGGQGSQRTEIRFDSTTGMVTLKLLVQDPNGYFIPNIRRDNFRVYENGVRQTNATVEIEHSPVFLAMLMEYGGRQRTLNRELGPMVRRAGRQILEQLGRQDQLTVFRYGNSLEQIADSSQGYDTLERAFSSLQAPDFSEANLYDALASLIQRMRDLKGRKAIVLLSSGLDTFSKISYDDLIKLVKECDTPVYVIGLDRSLRNGIGIGDAIGPAVKIDWQGAERELIEIARASGGRSYLPDSVFDLQPTYDDIMENLRVRYVITYKASTSTDRSTSRSVRVELVNSRNGGPLEIVDANGKTIRASVVLQASYVPETAADVTKEPQKGGLP
jgi:VWFA-related protein